MFDPLKMKLPLLFPCCLVTGLLQAQSIYQMPRQADTRWGSFENPKAAKGAGGQANRGAKGHAFELMEPGSSKELLNIDGAGVINRIWLTVSRRSPIALRSLKIEIFWDGAKKPAVSAPLGDFFCYPLCKSVPFENEFFVNAEGRSFECYIQMPYRKGARIVVTNEADDFKTPIFYEINFTRLPELPADALYFHAFFNRAWKGELGWDYAILPLVKGKGRFLGMNVSLRTDSTYGNSWWGEGEVKMYLDHDTILPTLAGTGTEDYFGSAWGFGKFCNRYQGQLLANKQGREWGFYRFHVPDPVYFHSDLKVLLQQIGGYDVKNLREIVRKGARLKPVTMEADWRLRRFLDERKSIDLLRDSLPEKAWVNFYRIDDYASVAYFYLDKPTSNLPPMISLAARRAYMQLVKERE